MKSEKEIMRPLYNRYRALKQTLATPNSVIAELFTHSVTLFVNIAYCFPVLWPKIHKLHIYYDIREFSFSLR